VTIDLLILIVTLQFVFILNLLKPPIFQSFTTILLTYFIVIVHDACVNVYSTSVAVTRGKVEVHLFRNQIPSLLTISRLFLSVGNVGLLLPYN